MQNNNQKTKINEFTEKGNFNTPTKDIPCDTTEYEISPNPETAVMNWYQCVENWRLQWLMEDIQDLLEVKGKSKVQIAHDRNEAKEIAKELKNLLENEKVTEEKQRNALRLAVVDRGAVTANA